MKPTKSKPRYRTYPIEVCPGTFYWECKAGIEIHSRITHREIDATVVVTIPWDKLKETVKRCQ